MRIALAQINVTVGDLDGNRAKIAQKILQARRMGANIVILPELAITGYPPEDLLLKRSFVEKAGATLRRMAPLSKGITTIVGFPDRDKKGRLANAAAILSDGKMVSSYHKMALPNYGVFDEKRYFSPGRNPLILELQTPNSKLRTQVGVSICEDIWVEDGSSCRREASAGARVLINISASPYHAGKIREREKLLAERARQFKAWIVYLNLVGGQDELVFDGGSIVVSPSGKILFRAPQFEEGLYLIDLPVGPASNQRPVTSHKSATPLEPEEEIFKALVLGTRDYFRKNGFSHAVLGMSGGIDSALTAAIAASALGNEKVTAVSMPSRYSSTQTQQDARTVAKRLGIKFLSIPIEPVFKGFLSTLSPVFRNRPSDVTEENLQARIRGILLMALSNKFHWLVLATGNKSELSTGYCTLYGDMVGGFAVIKDLPKGWVYRLSRWLNRTSRKELIPQSVIDRAPTAELKVNQRDQDTLPPYDHLDAILKAYVEEDLPAATIRKRLRTSRQEAQRVIWMIDAAEYKRRQAPIGIKITPRAFGKDRRMPITNRYRET